MSSQQKWFSPAQAADYLAVHVQTIYSWIYQGQLPAQYVGPPTRKKRPLRINVADLKKFQTPTVAVKKEIPTAWVGIPTR